MTLTEALGWVWEILRHRPAPKRPRTKPGQIEAAIAHEIAAHGNVNADLVEARHPDLLRASVVAAIRRRVKAGTLVKSGEVYRAPEIERPAIRVVES